jgi:hypothetical protein
MPHTINHICANRPHYATFGSNKRSKRSEEIDAASTYVAKIATQRTNTSTSPKVEIRDHLIAHRDASIEGFVHPFSLVLRRWFHVEPQNVDVDGILLDDRRCNMRVRQSRWTKRTVKVREARTAERC